MLDPTIRARLEHGAAPLPPTDPYYRTVRVGDLRAVLTALDALAQTLGGAEIELAQYRAVVRAARAWVAEPEGDIDLNQALYDAVAALPEEPNNA